MMILRVSLLMFDTFTRHSSFKHQGEQKKIQKSFVRRYVFGHRVCSSSLHSLYADDDEKISNESVLMIIKSSRTRHFLSVTTVKARSLFNLN
jgi:hypothetical protein